MKVIALNGSHNKDGNTAFMLKTVLLECEKNGIETELINVYDAVSSAKIPFCVCCSSPCNKTCYKDTMLDETFEKLRVCDAIVFGSPVYFGSMSGQLKCFFDKTRNVRANRYFHGKIGGVVTVGASEYGGQETTARAIQDAMFVDGMTIVGNASVEYGAGHIGACGRRDIRESETAILKAKGLGARIAEELLKR